MAFFSGKLGPLDTPSSRGEAVASRWYMVALAVFFAVCAVVFFAEDLSDVHTASYRPEGDGRYYYAYFRSLVFDRDLDFENDYRLLGNQFRIGKTDTGRYGNPFSIGPALYWAPFAPFAHIAAVIERSITGSGAGIDGTSTVYARVIQFGSLFWGFAGLLLVVRWLRRVYGAPLATITAIGLALATPLCWYMLRQAAYSHAISAFSGIAFSVYWHSTLYRRGLRQWAVLGLLLGLGMLVRAQNVGHGIPPLVEWLVLAAGALRARDRRGVLHLAAGGAIFAAVAIVAFSPQMLAWKAIYGSFVTVPQEAGAPDFMLWGHSRWIAVLFSSRHGLFAWSPILLVAVIALMVLAVRTDRGHAARRVVPVAMLLAVAFQAYVNGAVRDWWGGWAFGGRRFMSCAPYFALGLAAALSWVSPALSRIGPRFVAAAPAVLMLLFAGLNLGLMHDYRYGAAKHAQAQDMRPVWKRGIERAYDRAYDVIGNPGSAPASWVFAVANGVFPARYDAVSGMELLERRKSDTLAFTDGRTLVVGFGEPVEVDKVDCRVVEGDEARFLLPLRMPEELTASLKLHSPVEGAAVTIRVGGEPVLEARLVKGWKNYPFRIPAGALSSGINGCDVGQTVPKGGGGICWATLKVSRTTGGGK